MLKFSSLALAVTFAATSLILMTSVKMTPGPKKKWVVGPLITIAVVASVTATVTAWSIR